MTAAIELMTSPTRRRRRMPILIILSVGLIALVVLAAVLGPLLFPDAMRQDILSALLAPGQDGHLLGTDEFGRDVFAMTVAGTASARFFRTPRAKKNSTPPSNAGRHGTLNAPSRWHCS